MNKKIAVLIACHKQFNVLNTNYFCPVQVGSALSNKKIDGYLQDDVGDNISAKNKRYCELTAIYWAWKNIQANYYGLFHYRRYLSLRPTLHLPVTKYLSKKAIKTFGWTDNQLENLTEKYDIIVPKKVLTFGNYNQYKKGKNHYIRDLDFCIDVIKTNYPQIYPYAKKYLKSWTGYFCNMFIFKKEIFDNYCTWLFDILQKHEQKFDCADYNPYGYRVSGFLAERLLGVYITYLKGLKKYKIKHTDMVKIKYPNIAK